MFVKGKIGLLFVVNSNWDLFWFEEGGVFYLCDDIYWLIVGVINGFWMVVIEFFLLLMSLFDDGNWVDVFGVVLLELY